MTLTDDNYVRVDENLKIPLTLVAKAFDHYLGPCSKFKPFLIEFYNHYLNNYKNYETRA
jgi:hypothetical protein